MPDTNFTTFSKDKNGDEHGYDINGNIIYRKFSNGLEAWYYSDGKVAHIKLPNGREEVYEYDEDGHVSKIIVTSKNENMKNSKEQLETKIEELEKQLKVFKEELQNTKPKTIQEAEPGDVLEDGSIVIKKADGLALVVAPKCTEVKCSWSKEFTDVFESLTSHGFIVSQWFVPTVEQLEIAYSVIPDDFGREMRSYWSSEISIDKYADSIPRSRFARLGAYVGYTLSEKHSSMYNVRAFRCISY